jgi:hypothetical protein
MYLYALIFSNNTSELYAAVLWFWSHFKSKRGKKKFKKVTFTQSQE